MWDGLIEDTQRIFSLLRTSCVRKRGLILLQTTGRHGKDIVSVTGFTLIEIMIVGFLLTVVLAALFMSLNTADLSNSINSAKADLQAEVRSIMDWITKDVRQTNLIQINSNDPTGNHIKFKQVTGIDNITGQYTLSTKFIEYNYDSVLGKLTRNEIDGTSAIVQTWLFNNITQSPFYTQVGPNVPLGPGAILTSKKLIIIIAGKKYLRKSLTLNFSLTEEVKIRNE